MSFFGNLLGLAPAPVWTGNVVSPSSITSIIPFAKFGKQTYAEVRDDYILGLLGRAQDTLGSGGIRQWQPDATCTLYALNALNLACVEYYQSAFHDDNPPPAPAAGFIWFVPDGSPSGHAINAFKTPSGLRFADPQVLDQFRTLSPSELNSIYLAFFP